MVYGSDGICTGRNGRDFFVYRDNSSLSSTLLVDLEMETSVRLTEDNCL